LFKKPPKSVSKKKYDEKLSIGGYIIGKRNAE